MFIPRALYSPNYETGIMYEVKINQFSGPLEKLLELIEEKKMEITALSLAEVTGGFFNYVKRVEGDIDPKILADFLVVAAKLVLIKSKALLPGLELTQEEESDIKDLENRLKIYNEFRIASQYLKDLLSKQNISHSRRFLMNLENEGLFYPPDNLKLGDLSGAMTHFLNVLKELIPEQESVKPVMISLEQKVEELLARFKKETEQSFQQLAHKRSRAEIVIFFLAILHLIKDQIIQAEQPDQFSDIMFKKTRQL